MEKQKKSAVYIIPHSAPKCKPESKRPEMRPVLFSVLFSDEFNHFLRKALTNITESGILNASPASMNPEVFPMCFSAAAA